MSGVPGLEAGDAGERGVVCSIVQASGGNRGQPRGGALCCGEVDVLEVRCRDSREATQGCGGDGQCSIVVGQIYGTLVTQGDGLESA